jgi:hypothetical protein
MNPPPLAVAVDAKGQVTPSWSEWFMALFRDQKYKGSGVTASRPVNGLTVGDWYFDTTLNVPVWNKQITPSIVWVKADGTVA